MAAEMDQNMEVWKQVFQELIQEVKPRHKWTLTSDKSLLPNVLDPGWMQYQQWTFARFQCSSCSRSWASAQVQVLFHMHRHEKKRRGQVKMRVFAQRCKKCPQPLFEVPEFTQENITRILNNLVFRILKKCYREGFTLTEEIPAIKETGLKGPHDSYNCEACLQGLCALRGLNPATQSQVSPSSPIPSKDTGEPIITDTCIHLPCSQPSSKEDKLLKSTVNPKVPKLPKAAPKVNHTSKSSTVPTFTTQQIPCTLTVNPKVPSPPKADPKVSHTPKSSTAPTFSTQRIPSLLIVNSQILNSKPDLKVSHTQKPSTAPTFPTQQKPALSIKNPKDPNLPKADPKVSHTSKPSTVATFTTQQMPSLSKANSQITHPKTDLTVSHTPKPSTAPTFSTQYIPSIENPKVPNPKISHTPNPSNAPAFSTQQVPPMSLAAHCLTTQMPSSTNCNTAADAPARNKRPKTGRSSFSSSLPVEPTWNRSPITCSPRANTISQVERSIQIDLSPEHSRSCTPSHSTCRRFYTCFCCLILILTVTAIVVIALKAIL